MPQSMVAQHLFRAGSSSYGWHGADVSSTHTDAFRGKRQPTFRSQAPDMQKHGRDTGYDGHDPNGTTVAERAVSDDILPNGPHQKTRRYVAPFADTNHQDDCRVAREFSSRIGWHEQP